MSRVQSAGLAFIVAGLLPIGGQVIAHSEQKELLAAMHRSDATGRDSCALHDASSYLNTVMERAYRVGAYSEVIGSALLTAYMFATHRRLRGSG